MSRAHDLFRPNGLKLLLAATLAIPVFFVLVLVTGFPYNNLVFPALPKCHLIHRLFHVLSV